MLFGKQPRVFLQQAGLLATFHRPDGSELPRNFDGPMVLIPAQLEAWLEDRLMSKIDRSHAARKETTKLPFEPIREGVVNAETR